MSLRYKILAAVIGINVVILFATFATVFVETVKRSREFRAFRVELLDEVEAWALATLARGGTPDWSAPNVDLVVRYGPDEGAEHLAGERLEPGVEAVVRDRVLEAMRARTILKNVEEGTVVIPRPDMWIPVGKEEEGEVRSDGLYLHVDYPDLGESMPGLKRIYVAMVLGTVLLMVVTFLLVSRVILAPIDSLVTAANRIARGDYSQPVPSTRREDEIETLIEAFNAMMVEVGSYRQHLEERVQDATRKVKLVEKNLTIAQRLAATGTLASGIAHEVNNPLGGMINAVRRLRSGTLSPEKQAEYLEVVEDGLGRVRETVKRILQFTPHRVKPQAVDLRMVLDRALGLVAHRAEKRGCEIRVDVPEATLFVFGDPFELQQVFLNLVINAVDASGGGGRSGRIDISGDLVGTEVRLRVTDHGRGMDEREAALAFDLFFTTKDTVGGSGLGLSIVHNIVTNHGGRIELQSEPGEGTTFTVWLPQLAGPDGET